MRRILVLMILIAAGTLVASDRPAQKKTKPAPAKVQAITIPDGAVETEPRQTLQPSPSIRCHRAVSA